MEKKGKMRNGVSEKKRKGPSLAARMVPNMVAGGSHSQTMLRVPEETGDETEEEEEKKERKNDERGSDTGGGRVPTEREGQEENREGGEKGEMKKNIVVVQREATQSKEDEYRVRGERRDEQWESVRRRELSSEGRKETEELGEKVGEELKVAAREEELTQEEWESRGGGGGGPWWEVMEYL